MNFELIDEFRRRTNASYDEANYYLGKSNGDLLEAIIDYEKEKTSHGPRRNTAGRGGRLLNTLIRVVQRLIDIKLVVSDKTEKTFHVPLIILLILGPIWHILLVAAIVMLILGYRFSFLEIHNPAVNVTDFVDRIKSKIRENN